MAIDQNPSEHGPKSTDEVLGFHGGQVNWSSKAYRGIMVHGQYKPCPYYCFVICNGLSKRILSKCSASLLQTNGVDRSAWRWNTTIILKSGHIKRVPQFYSCIGLSCHMFFFLGYIQVLQASSNHWLANSIMAKDVAHVIRKLQEGGSCIPRKSRTFVSSVQSHPQMKPAIHSQMKPAIHSRIADCRLPWPNGCTMLRSAEMPVLMSCFFVKLHLATDPWLWRGWTLR